MAVGLGRDYRKLWAALSVSLLGSEISLLALPLYAAVTLQSSPLQMGVLASIGQLPYLLCSLPAGVVADRVRRRPLLVGCDIVSAGALVSVPIATAFDGPGFVHLCSVAFVVGTATVFTEVAHYAYVPVLVGRRDLTQANSRLQVSYSVAESAGPGIGGLLVQLITAPFAVLVNAVTFVVSGVLLASIRDPEPPPDPEPGRASMRRTLLDGMKPLLSHPLLRPIIVTGIFVAFFEAGITALYVVYATRELGLNAATIGLVFVIGGLGALPGAVLARRVAERIGVGPAIAAGLFGSAATAGVLPFVSGGPAVVIAFLGVAKALGALLFTVANIHQWTLRQSLTPDRIAGRVTAAQRFLVYGSGSLGALAGGALAEAVGLRAALLALALGALISPLFTVASPVRGLQRQPGEVEDGNTDWRPTPDGPRNEALEAGGSLADGSATKGD